MPELPVLVLEAPISKGKICCEKERKSSFKDI